MSWDEGYVSQIEYSRFYFRTLNPLLINLALLVNGHPALAKRPLRYLELGFGQGLSLNIHAAACEGEYWGNDFMPSQAITAKDMADASGANIHILDDSFAELAERNDLPEFDIIVLCGIWTWISAENHRLILKIIKSKLALGGVVYISYNVSPGFTPMMPVRDLMLLHINTASPANAPLTAKIKSAMAFMRQLMDVDAAYFSKTPSAVAHFNRAMQEIDSDHLAHEYFGDHWAIISFADMAAQLSGLGLTFAGDATINNRYTESLLSPKIKSLLDGISDPLFYQTVRDFCINAQFRTDLWLKGCRPPSSKLQCLQAIAEMRFTLVSTQALEETLEVSTSLGKVSLDKKMVRPIIEALADNNFEPKSINVLLGYPSLKHLTLLHACEMMLSLCGVCVEPAHDEETVALLKPRTDKLNTYFINQSQCDNSSMFLASPVTGGGIRVLRVQQLSLLALRNGFSTVDAVANFIWETLSPQEQFVVTPKGVPCKGKSENLKELALHVTSFFETRLPILTALKIS